MLSISPSVTGWLAGLRAEISDPSWSADVLATLVGAVLPLIAAVLILRRQLRHDRLIAFSQIESSRSLAQGQPRATAARRLGREIAIVLRELRHSQRETVASNLRRSEPSPWHDALQDACQEAELELGLNATVAAARALADEMDRRWACVRTEGLAELTKQSQVASVGMNDERVIGEAALYALSEVISSLRELATAAADWDGIGDGPGDEVVALSQGDFYPRSPGLFGARRKAWTTSVVNDFIYLAGKLSQVEAREDLFREAEATAQARLPIVLNPHEFTDET